MNSSRFEKNQFKHLAALVNSSPKELELILNSIDDCYKEWSETKTDKKSGSVKTYRDGTPKSRTIRPPKNRLKEIQRDIIKNILSKVEFPENIHGGLKGKTNITNAIVHKGKKYKFTTDLQEFFPSITNKMVHNAYLSIGLSNHHAYWLTKLTTWKYQLPQGAPTSTHISNIVFKEIDQQLILLAKENGLTYTRYIDDLTFSSQEDFSNLIDQIIKIVSAQFKLSRRKTFYKADQTITGIKIFNNYIDAPSKIKHKAKEEQSSDVNNKPYSTYLKRIRSTNSAKLRKTKHK